MKNPQNSNQEAPAQADNAPQILQNIFSHPVAGIKAFSQNILLSDVLADGNYRLITADISSNLKVFKGNVLQNEAKLPVCPVGIASYYAQDTQSKNIIPFLAVAGGVYIYIYKNLKGSTKSHIPNQEANAEEVAIYSDFAGDKIDDKTCLTMLKELSLKLANGAGEDLDNGVCKLSTLTIELLNTIKGEENQLNFLNENKGKKIVINNYISYFTTISKSYSSSATSPSYLVVGTETKMIIIIDPSTNKVQSKIVLPEVPFIISCFGGFDADHTFFVADRINNIYIIGKNNQIRTTINVMQSVSNMIVNNKNKYIYVSTIGKLYQCYGQTGNKVFSIIQNSPIIALELYHCRKEDTGYVLMALKNNELRLYKEKALIHVFILPDTIFGMKAGRFGVDDECLVLVTYTGALSIKKFNPAVVLGSLRNDPDYDKKEGTLIIPKKTPMYLDLVEREKESCVEMQNTFQNDLLRLRYKALDTYVKMLKIGNAPQNYSSSSTMKISASLQGLGPNFKLSLILDNVGKEPIYNSELTLDYNRKIYTFNKESINLGIIMPNIPMKYSLSFKNISEGGSGGIVKVIVVDKLKSSPLIQSTIKVPVSELEML